MLRLAILALSLASARVEADSELEVRAKYEDQLIQMALRRHGFVLETAPEGKLIEAVVVDATTVLTPSDFSILRKIPIVAGYLALDKLHVRTRDEVIAREVLIKAGERYAWDRVLESGRNLRSLFILSVARIVAVRGSQPDTVRLLVITKDQWSLRLNTEITIDQARLDFLSFSIAENNIAGRNKTANLDFAIDPGRYTLGAGYSDPRVWGSRYYYSIALDAYLRRADSVVEGGYFSAGLGRPLYSLRTKWAWAAGGSYLTDVARVFKGPNLLGLQVGTEVVPIVYAREIWSVSVSGTRSWGLQTKLNLTWGFGYSGRKFGLPPDFPSSFSDDAAAALLAFIPRSERASGPYVSLQAFRAAYVQLRNIDTFALTEDFRIGPSLAATVRWAAPYFGLESHFLELSGSVGSTHIHRDNLISYSVSGALRIQTNVVPNSPLANELVSAAFREVTPRFGPFRLHVAGTISLRNHDLNNTLVSLGSSSGLRGYSAREFIGNSSYRGNVELRSVALNLWTLHLGGVVFYDVGDAPKSLAQFSVHQDAGVGIRLLIPQFNRSVLRMDLAFPFEYATGGGYEPRFSAEFGQAF